jgi:hypothetical protein
MTGPAGTGHPLPESEEARHDEIPEGLERAKGEGDDGKKAARSRAEAVDPDGDAYPV